MASPGTSHTRDDLPSSTKPTSQLPFTTSSSTTSTNSVATSPEAPSRCNPNASPKQCANKFIIPPHPLSSSRYHRQLLVPSISIRGQEALSRAKVLIIGLGGLGSPASLYLSGAGIGTIGLIDADTVELSNLHRQIVHTEAAARKRLSKVKSAIFTLRERNSEVTYVGYNEPFSSERALDILQGKKKKERKREISVAGRDDKDDDTVVVEGGYDIVLDCTDNPATRYLISDACVALGKILVSGAAQRAEGQLMRLCYPPLLTRPRSPSLEQSKGPLAVTEMSRPDGDYVARRTPSPRGPCYRCIFPHPPSQETVQPCSEIGILGPVVGIMGTLMAMDVVKIVIAAQGRCESWKPNLLLYNALSDDPRAMFRTVGLRRAARLNCLVCGDDEVLQKAGKRKITADSIKEGLVDYVQFCGGSVVEKDLKVLAETHRVNADEFRNRMQETKNAKTRQLIAIDVREEVEYDLGAKVDGSINIPISTISKLAQQNFQTRNKIRHLLREHGYRREELTPEEDEEMGEEDDRSAYYFICQRGIDSQTAAQKFLDADEQMSTTTGERKPAGGGRRWIGDVVGGIDALLR